MVRRANWHWHIAHALRKVTGINGVLASHRIEYRSGCSSWMEALPFRWDKNNQNQDEGNEIVTSIPGQGRTARGDREVWRERRHGGHKALQRQRTNGDNGWEHNWNKCPLPVALGSVRQETARRGGAASIVERVKRVMVLHLPLCYSHVPLVQFDLIWKLGRWP